MRRNPVSGAKESERDAVHFENKMRTQLGGLFFTQKIALRQWYGNTDVLRRDFDYNKNKLIPVSIPYIPRWKLHKGI